MIAGADKPFVDEIQVLETSFFATKYYSRLKPPGYPICGLVMINQEGGGGEAIHVDAGRRGCNEMINLQGGEHMHTSVEEEWLAGS